MYLASTDCDHRADWILPTQWKHAVSQFLHSCHDCRHGYKPRCYKLSGGLPAKKPNEPEGNTLTGDLADAEQYDELPLMVW